MPTLADKYLAEVVSDLLEKMVDVQSSQTERLTSITEMMRSTEKDMEYVAHQFSNGFRSEIKKHITDSLNPLKEQIDRTEQQLSITLREVRSYRKIGFWAKILTGFLVTMAGIAFAAAEITASLTGNDTDGMMKVIQQNQTIIQELRKEVDDLSRSRGKNNVPTSRPGI